MAGRRARAQSWNEDLTVHPTQLAVRFVDHRAGSGPHAPSLAAIQAGSLDRYPDLYGAGVSERLPVVSGRQLIDVLGKLGWVAVRQRGTATSCVACSDSVADPADPPSSTVGARGRSGDAQTR
jgi:hypothetical protein